MGQKGTESSTQLAVRPNPSKPNTKKLPGHRNPTAGK